MTSTYTIQVSNSRAIAFPCAAVFAAVEDELRNLSGWARPYLSMGNAAERAPLAPGQEIRLGIGPLGFPWMQMRVVEVAPPVNIVVDYIGGDFAGYGAFALRGSGADTEVVFSWNATPASRRMRLAARLLPIRQLHWVIVDRVLRNLEQHVRKHESKRQRALSEG